MNNGAGPQGVILRMEDGALVPWARIGVSAHLPLLAEELGLVRPLCVEAAIRFPGLLSVSRPRQACACPLNHVCGDSTVQTMRVVVPSVCADCVLMLMKPETHEPAQVRKEDMLALASHALGEPVRPSSA